MKKFLVLIMAAILSLSGIGCSSEKTVRPRKGPVVTDYNKGGFKIIKVVRFEKEKNALGKMLDRDVKFEVGQATEMDHDLFPEYAGEQYLIRWKYTGKDTYDKVRFNFEFKLANRVNVQKATREYQKLTPGSHKLIVKNIGKSFARGGKIQYWRVTIEADARLMAEMKSVSWDAFARERQAADNSKTGEES